MLHFSGCWIQELSNWIQVTAGPLQTWKIPLEWLRLCLFLQNIEWIAEEGKIKGHDHSQRVTARLWCVVWHFFKQRGGALQGTAALFLHQKGTRGSVFFFIAFTSTSGPQQRAHYVLSTTGAAWKRLFCSSFDRTGGHKLWHLAPKQSLSFSDLLVF